MGRLISRSQRIRKVPLKDVISTLIQESCARQGRELE